MKAQYQLLALLLVAVFAVCLAQAQPNLQPCHLERMADDVGVSTTCPPGIPLTPDSFHPTPLTDGGGEPYQDPDGNVVSLYGQYGNDENNASKPPAYAHYLQGTTLGEQHIQPLCKNGLPPSQDGFCHNGDLIYPPAIIFLFLGLSNWEIEIGGGSMNAWQGPNHPNLAGQPCATLCENLNNPDELPPWEIVPGEAADSQKSLLYQVYSQTPLVGPHVVLFNGALGQQSLSKWDITSNGYYWSTPCNLTHMGGIDPECNYHRVLEDLTRNGYSEAQVQAVFFKSSTSFPQCDLKHLYCDTTITNEPDAYTSERFLGNILRYLKCCKLNAQKQSTGIPRYPNLQQVFLTSRTYAGYAQNPPQGASQPTAGCVSPEPYAYEEGIAVQRIIVAQINQDAGMQFTDPYSGTVAYKSDGTGNAPWFDWGPYIWTSGAAGRSDQYFWCGGQGPPTSCAGSYDVRSGYLPDEVNFWGDFTHPSAKGQEKVAGQLVKFIQHSLAAPQTFISDWVSPWITIK